MKKAITAFVLSVALLCTPVVSYAASTPSNAEHGAAVERPAGTPVSTGSNVSGGVTAPIRRPNSGNKPATGSNTTVTPVKRPESGGNSSGSSNPGTSSNARPGEDMVPSDEIKIQDLELSIICTNLKENLTLKNLKVDIKTEHCYVYKIEVNRYNKADIYITSDDGYRIINGIENWTTIDTIGINNISRFLRGASVDPGGKRFIGIIIEVTADVSTNPAENDTEENMLEKCVDRFGEELKELESKGISEEDAKAKEEVKKYVENIASKILNEKVEYEVKINETSYSTSPAFSVSLWAWIKGDRETLQKSDSYRVTINHKKVTLPGNTSSNTITTRRPNSGGNAASSTHSSGGSANTSSINPSRQQTTSVTKPSITSGTWSKNSTGWRLRLSNGAYASSQWANIGGKWYILGQDGYMLTGWQKVNGVWYLMGTDGDMKVGWNLVNGKWYYMDSTGAMLENTTTPDGYVVGASGEWIK